MTARLDRSWLASVRAGVACLDVKCAAGPCQNERIEGGYFCGLHGPEKQNRDPDARLVCPHCQVLGGVKTRSVRRRRGISGGKATAGWLTGGASLLLTGLSREEQAKEAHCENCGTTWIIQ